MSTRSGFAPRDRARAFWFGSASLAASLALTIAAAPSSAEACGCLSPPDPVVLGDDDFAVNQQAEQIIFEVEEGTITAHVLIRYAGDPSQFAWIVPVPSVPELGLSPAAAFAMIDDQTAPLAYAYRESVCPVPEYRCEHHLYPSCSSGDGTGGDGAAYDGYDDGGGGTGGDEGGAGDGDSPPPGIDVIDMQQVGSYETVTFSAAEADLAVQWLQDNGFIVNDTMTPYMMPYVEAGMVFVAAKLVAGAGIDAIEPLRLTYADTNPMIPLMLTAVASEPHLTVTAYVYGDTGFRPSVRPIAVIDPARIASDPNGRSNYPQVLSRTVDEIGGDGWVVEYGGLPPISDFPDASGCCGDFDGCGIGGDMACQCPTSEFDADDCGAIPGLLDAIALVDGLANDHARLTRLTTRISPEEMTFDPQFEPDPDAPVMDRLRLEGVEYDLSGCEPQVMEPDALDEILDRTACSTTYCGAGECVVTSAGAGCRCDAGFVARRFTDLDGLGSITCVPEVPPVDLAAETVLPDACAGIACGGTGTCVDLGGVPSCACDEGSAGVVQGTAPACAPISQTTGTPGAENYTGPIVDLPVCAPPPPDCGEWGWLVPTGSEGIHGQMCPMSIPAPEDLQIPPPPTCADLGMDEPGAGGDDSGAAGGGCGCTASSDRDGWIAMIWGFAVIAGWRLRRSSRRRAER